MRFFFFNLISVFLVLGQVLSADGLLAETALALPVKQFVSREEIVPPELGRLKTIGLAPPYEQIYQSKGIDAAVRKLSEDSRPFVVLIEDAHASLEAQMNIAGLIRHLGERFQIRLLALEGAEGRAPLDKFQTLTGDSQDEVLDFYLREFLLSGPEYEALRSGGNYEVYGIEAIKLYEADRKIYLELSASAYEISRRLNQIQDRLALEKKKTYSPELADWDRKEREFRKNPGRAFNSFVPFLVRTAAVRGARLPESSDLYRLARILEDVSEVSLRNVEQETALFSQENPPFKTECEILEKRFLPRGLDFNFSVTGPPPEIPALFLYRYRNLRNYLALAELRSRLDTEQLFGEIDQLCLRMKKMLARNSRELELDRKSGQLDALRRVLLLEARPEDIDPKLGLGAFAGKLELGAHLKRAELFYRLAKQRDEALALNTLGAIEESKVKPKAAILVAGGFHTPGIRKVLENMKVSYLILSPRFEAELVNDKLYRMRLADDLSLAGSTLAAPRRLFEAGVREEIFEALARARGRGEATKAASMGEDRGMSSRIIEAPSFQNVGGMDLAAYARKLRAEQKVQTIYFDLDNTLFRSMGYLSSGQWFRDAVREFGIERALSWWANNGHEYRQIQNGFFYRLSEPGVIGMIERLKQEGFQVIGFTRRIGSRDKTRTDQILDRLGIHLSRVLYADRDGSDKKVLFDRTEEEGGKIPALYVDDSAENVRRLLEGRPHLFGVHYANPDTYLEDRWTFRDYVRKAEESFAQAEQDQSRGYWEKARKHYRHSFEYYFNAVIKILELEGIDRPQAYAELEKINTALTHFVAKQVEGKWQLINLVREAKEGRSPFFHDVPKDRRPPATVNPWAVTGRDLEMTLQDMFSSRYLRGPEELILKLRRRVMRVYGLADQLGDVFDLPDEIKSVLRVASLIHDLGKGYSDNSLELHFQPVDRKWLPEGSQKTLDAFLEDGFKILDGDHERRHKPRRPIEVPAESKLLVRYVNDQLSDTERRDFESDGDLLFATLLFKLAYEYSERVSIRPEPDESRDAAGRIRNREDVEKWLDSKRTDGTIDKKTHSKILPVFQSAFVSQERSTSSIGQGLPEPRFHKEIMELEPFRPLSMIALTSLLITTGPSSADIIRNQQRGMENLLNQLVKEALVKAVGPAEAERMMDAEPKTIDGAVLSLRGVTPAGRERIRQIFSQKQKILERYGISYFSDRASAFLDQDLERSLRLVEEFERDLKLLGEMIDERFQRTRQHYQQLRDQFRAAQEGFRRYLIVEDDPGFQWYWRIKILRRHPPHTRKSIQILLAKSPEEAMQLIGSQGPSYPGPEMVISDLQMPVTDPKTGQSILDNDAGWRLSRWIRQRYPRAFVLVQSMTPFPTAAAVDGALHKYNSFYGEYILDMIEQAAISQQRARASGRPGRTMPFEGLPPLAGRSLGRPSPDRMSFGSREVAAVFQKNLMEGREPAFLLLPSSLLGGVESVSLETVLRNPANKVIILWDGDEKGRPLISPGQRFDHLMKTGAASCMGRKNFSPNIANSQLDEPSSLGGKAEAASRALLSRGIGPERISFLKPASMRERVNGALSLREGPHLPLYLMLYLIQTQGMAVNDLLGILRRDAETGDYSVVLSKELERIFREAMAERLRAQAA